MAIDESVVERPPLDVHTGRRLLVTQRQSLDRRYRAMGFLAKDEVSGYSFSYLASAVNEPWFRALPGLSRADHVYRSAELFPLFAERVVSARRPDREATMRALALPAQAEPFDVLTRSGGRRVGDLVELVPVPTARFDGHIALQFFAHGVRHSSEEAQRRILELRRGDRLVLTPEPSNRANPRALLMIDSSELALGWVPDPLVEFVHEVMAGPRYELRVEQANQPEVGYHFRLLVGLEGNIAPGIQPFSGPDWATTGN